MDVQTSLKPIIIPVNALVQKLFPSLKLCKDLMPFTNMVWHNLILFYSISRNATYKVYCTNMRREINWPENPKDSKSYMHNQDILLSDGSIQFALFIKSKSPRTWHNFFDSVTAFLGKGQHIFPTQHTLDMKNTMLDQFIIVCQ